MKVFAIASAVLSVFASLVAAQEGVDWTVPVGEPKGNSIIKPGLNEQVPVGKPYPVTWIPDTLGTITIVLYKGPGNNIIPQYAIAKKIANTGTFMWTPDTTFPDVKEGYGLRIIVDGTGQNQWSTQFGFSNPDFKGDTTSSAVSTSTATGSTSKPTSTKTSSGTVTSTRTGNSTVTTTKSSTTKAVTTETSTVIPDTTLITTTIRPNSTTTGPATTSTAGAASMGVHFGMGAIAFAVAGFQLF